MRIKPKLKHEIKKSAEKNSLFGKYQITAAPITPDNGQRTPDLADAGRIFGFYKIYYIKIICPYLFKIDFFRQCVKEVKDYYFRKAKQEKYVARSVYKLSEIDAKHHIIRPRMRLLDLGASPGSWLQYTLEKTKEQSEIVCVDLKPPVFSPPGCVRWITGDIYEVFEGEAGVAIGFFDCVISDMAPNTTGIRMVDHAASASLCEKVLEISSRMLKPRGTVLYKIFQGSGFDAVYKQTRQLFETVKTLKPQSCRSESNEVYVLGLHRKIPANKD
ncbi:hypothetical protein CHS0354_018444 [Potamilus streckersoni]|uniref:rRNA methyltransferase 2, mitochondrial n=1 Tax=Potamilus streckersoni TaxID=2493646 RepID=A0AAE0TBK9_9BIVA|nr:hypothetical protein CHS0354_018444 [Potamilus streckersoni]